jgi:hypothetical protein
MRTCNGKKRRNSNGMSRMCGFDQEALHPRVDERKVEDGIGRGAQRRVEREERGDEGGDI